METGLKPAIATVTSRVSQRAIWPMYMYVRVDPLSELQLKALTPSNNDNTDYGTVIVVFTTSLLSEIIPVVLKHL